MARRRKNTDDNYGINPQPGLFIASAAGAVAGSAVIAAIAANQMIAPKSLKEQIRKVAEAWKKADSGEQEEAAKDWGVLANLAYVSHGKDGSKNFTDFLEEIHTQRSKNKKLIDENRDLKSKIDKQQRLVWELDDMKSAHANSDGFSEKIQAHKQTDDWKKLNDEREARGSDLSSGEE